MKKIISFFLLIALVSCQKEIKKQFSIAPKTDINLQFKKEDLVDTIFFSDDENSKYEDFAVANLIDKEYNKDSICLATFRLFFIKNNKIIYSYKIQINGFDEGSDWGEGQDLDTISGALKTISVGYPACGYTWNHYLFDVSKNNSSLVYEWYSNSDSGWGTYTKFIAGNNKNFYCRTVSFSPKDDNEDDIGIEEYLDSIKFEKINGKWVKKRITPKDSVYRKTEKSFDNFHKGN